MIQYWIWTDFSYLEILKFWAEEFINEKLDSC